MSAYQDVGVSIDSQSVRRSRIVSKQNSRRYNNSELESQENEFMRGYNINPRVNNSFAFNDTNYRTLNASKLTER